MARSSRHQESCHQGSQHPIRVLPQGVLRHPHEAHRGRRDGAGYSALCDSESPEGQAALDPRPHIHVYGGCFYCGYINLTKSTICSKVDCEFAVPSQYPNPIGVPCFVDFPSRHSRSRSASPPVRASPSRPRWPSRPSLPSRHRPALALSTTSPSRPVRISTATTAARTRSSARSAAGAPSRTAPRTAPAFRATPSSS